MSARLVLSLAALLSSVAAAQAPPEPPEARLLRACVRNAEVGRLDSAAILGKTAEELFRRRMASGPRDVEAIVGTARTLSQCLVPSAEFMTQGELSSEAIELLERALAIEPRHWLGRFLLASIAYRSPAFLGRGPRAAKEFDELLRQQGDRTDNPLFARVFELRGRLFDRSGQADSARSLWMHGANLFPQDSVLRSLAGKPVVAPPSASVLETVKIVTSSAPPPAPLPSVRDISRTQVLTSAGGAADVFQAVQSQPGATRVGEGSDVYTRGGHPGETALIVNGGRLLSLSRFEGLNGSLFGAIEPFVVKSVRYSSGGFSARNGNALSGVIEIETDGKPRERAMRAGLSLVQASGTARFPTSSRIGGWISGRASHTRALLATHGRTAEFQGSPHSEEMIASLVALPTPTSELRATAIVERDDSRRNLAAAGWQGPFHSSGATRAVLLNSRWMSSSAPVVIRSSVAGSDRSSNWDFGVLSRTRDDASLVSRVDAEWQSSAMTMFRAGIEQGAHARDDAGTLPTSPSVATGSDTRTLSGNKTSARQLGAYSEAELTWNGSTMILGARADRLPGETSTTFDPRIALSTRRGDFTARLSAGVFHQASWRAESAIPDAGVPGGTPTEARHLVATLERAAPNGSYWRAEGYVKKYGDYKEFGAGPQPKHGDARGLDFTVQSGTTSRLTGWIGYSLLDANVTLKDGRTMHSPFDVTHTATGSATVTLGRDWSVGSTVRYGTGTPLTPILGATTSADRRISPVYGPMMSERLPDYFRVDARIMRYIRTPSFLLTTFIEIINAGNRANVSSLTYDASYRNPSPVPVFFAQRTFVMGGEFQFR